MPLKPYVRETAYAVYVQARVGETLRYLNQHYTVEELAAACNVKPTHNFRRVLNLQAHYGNIEKHYIQNADLRIIAVYSRKGSQAP